MLEGFGLRRLVWNTADDFVGGAFVASPMDAEGRGIALEVREGGAACDLSGATAYFVWRHRSTGRRGTVEFEAVDASAGEFRVFYPAAMCGASGVVDASVMLSLGGARYLATRTFQVRVERAVVDGLEPEDGFTLFVRAIAAYESANGVSGDAASAANRAAAAASRAAEDLRAAAARGDFDGADGFSPSVTVEQTDGGAVITVTDRNGTTTADVARGVKGDAGERGPKGAKGDAGPAGPAGPAGADGTVFTPASPLALADGVLSIDLSGYATKAYVDGALAGIGDLSGMRF